MVTKITIVQCVDSLIGTPRTIADFEYNEKKRETGTAENGNIKWSLISNSNFNVESNAKKNVNLANAIDKATTDTDLSASRQPIRGKPNESVSYTVYFNY